MLRKILCIANDRYKRSVSRLMNNKIIYYLPLITVKRLVNRT